MKSAVVWRRDGDREAIDAPAAEIETRDGEIRAAIVDGRRVPVRVAIEGDAIHVWCAGDVWEFERASPDGPRPRAGRDDAGLRAPMPGRIVRLLVAEGDEVGRGATLLILEAMKMEHEIKAPHDGKVLRLPYRVGDQVDAGAPLVEFAG